MNETSVLVNARPVDRRPQLDMFSEVLDRVDTGRPLSFSLLEFYGGPGIGKTTLMRLFAQICDSRQVPYAWISFRGASAKRYSSDPTYLVEELLQQLPIRNARTIAAIEAFKKAERPEHAISAYFDMRRGELQTKEKTTWLKSLREVTDSFVKGVAELSRAQSVEPNPVALFLDEADVAELKLVDWMEEWIIAPLLQLKSVVIVWAARKPWRWKRPEIRRRTRTEQLQVFDEEAVIEQIRSNVSELDESESSSLAETLFNQVQVVTGGHPFANNLVIGQINAWRESGQTSTGEDVQDRTYELLQVVFERFVSDYTLDRTRFSPQVRDAVEFLALVRMFDSTMLRRILVECAGHRYRDWSQEEFGKLLNSLKDTELLFWDRDKGYAIDPPLRHIVGEYFFVCQRQTYVTANRAASGVYRDWLDRSPDNSVTYIVEDLFHQVCLQRAGELVDIEVALKQRIGDHAKWFTDQAALVQSLERLEGALKHDDELSRLTNGESSTRWSDLVRQEREQLVISSHPTP